MRTPVWVIIPTYNESANLDGIVRATVAELGRSLDGAFHVLIVDDNSPDGTGAIADALVHELEPVEVLHRPGKDGLGHAYLAGFERALDAGAAVLVEMDADFSHDPAHLPALLAASDDADVVLGSRYVPGGGVEDWGILRRVISRGGGWYARMVLRVDIRDLTGGFKAIRREVLEAIDLPSVRAEGYVFQIELTYRALLAGFTVREIPIIFRDRTAGTSKMSPRIALEATRLVPRLRRSARLAIAAGAPRDTAPPAIT